MSYASATEFRQAFGDSEAVQLATRVSGGAVDATLDVFLARAASEMDSRLAVRYAVPVVGASVLKAPCMDIARYRLFDDAAPETVRERYQDAIRWLADLATGRAVLRRDTGGVAPAPTDDPGAAAQAVPIVRDLTYGEQFREQYRTRLL
jgi:phage gp36-like protein